MTIPTIPSREFNQGPSEAKRAANNGPVHITDRGRPAHVLMSFEHYQQLTAFSAPNWTPIPRQTGHLVQRKLDTCSSANWTLIPLQTGQFEAA
jgi:prevent-host-death family protein